MSKPHGTGELPTEVGIKRLGPDGLAALMADLGQPAYRTGQLVSWLYGRAARSYDEMTDMPAGLRGQLADRQALSFPTVADKQVSSDGTRKYLLRFADGVAIETVGLPAGDRLTVCFSTQAGCAMGCSFCATGESGFTRNLGPGEMVDQLRVVAEDFGKRVTNTVAMGQGEPFANYDAVLDALRIINDPRGPAIGARHVTVSTCGLVAGIDRFAEEPEQFTLAISLHSAVQETRDMLMPGVRGIPLTRLRSAIDEYGKKTGRRPSLEYALIDGVNDTDAQTEQLIEFCRDLLVHVNLIPVNPVSAGSYRRPHHERARRVAARLSEAGVGVSIRAERGADIDAACGQLRQRDRDE